MKYVPSGGYKVYEMKNRLRFLRVFFLLILQAFNVLRYQIGQKYNSHYDVFNPAEYGPQKSQRVMKSSLLNLCWGKLFDRPFCNNEKPVASLLKIARFFLYQEGSMEIHIFVLTMCRLRRCFSTFPMLKKVERPCFPLR